MLDIVLVEVPNPNHPFGVRGVGKVPIVPPMAAIANAIYRATGMRLNRLPMSPGRVLEALWAKNATGNGAHLPAPALVAAANCTARRHDENGTPSGEAPRHPGRGGAVRRPSCHEPGAHRGFEAENALP